MLKQTTKFYISSFLKNQTYFTPILIVFLQAQTLDYQQIFWVFTIGSIVSFLLEIPTGIFADFYGKKRSVIISKIFIFASFMTYGFANSFWLFVLAQAMFEFGNSFRTGTETAFIYDYLKQTKDQPGYTEVKGKQKFWARAGESIATAAGGVIAGQLGYNWAFFFAAIPAFGNVINAFVWEDIEERHDDYFSWKETWTHTKDSVCQLCNNKHLLIITVNITLFTAVVASMDKFIQPYMENVGIPIEYFGFVYAASLALTAIAVRYSYVLEDKFGKVKTINALSILAIIPAMIIGFKFVSIIGVVLFFIIIIIENFRSPIANNAFHGLVKSEERATLGSILSQVKSLGKMVILPVAGFFADTFSLYIAMMILAGILLLNGVLFYIRKNAASSSTQ